MANKYETVMRIRAFLNGFKKVADTMAAKQVSSLSLDDDDEVPF